MNHLKTYSIIILSALVFLLGACKNKDVTPDTFKISNEKVEATASSVTIRGSYDFIGHVEGMEINIGKREDLIDADRHEMQLEGSDFSVTVIGLDPNTTYYYRYSVDFGNNEGTLYPKDNPESFTTQPLTDAPAVETVSVLCIDSTTFRVYCKIISVGGGEVTERGVYWSTHNDPTELDSVSVSSTETGDEYICELSHLEGSTRYYVRAYAKNDYGRGTGGVLDFKTGAAPGAPTVSTNEEVDNLTATSVTIFGNVGADGGSPVTERGVCWSTLPNPTVSGDHEAAQSAGLGLYSTTIAGLYPNTTYHVRCYATNARGTGYGNDITITTQDGLPTVTTSGVVNITATTATGGGNVTASGANPVTERGICWSKSHNPDLDHCLGHKSNGNGEGSYTVEITDLETGQTYYVRAYATNSYGTAYGDEVHFTPTDGLPVVRTDTVTDITRTSAKGHGTVIAEGASGVNERGICWGTNDNPTLDDCLGHKSSGSGEGEYFAEMTNLAPETTYYMVAYAKNGEGTSYGTAKSFTTLPPEHYTISVAANPSNGGTVTGGGQYNNNQSCTVSATANTGYAFVKWTENGEEVSTEADYTFTVTGNRDLVAEFQVQSYTIEVSANPSNGGTVTGGGTYQQGQFCTVQASANSGYKFVKWTNEDETQVSNDASYTFNVTGDRNLVAQFEQLGHYNITVNIQPTGGGNVTGAGAFNEGETCTLHAMPNTGYTWVGWKENGNIISQEQTLSFTVNSNRNLIAQFQAQAYTISVSANPSNGGSPYVGSTPGNTSGTYTNGQSCTVHANPATGYTFVRWTENGNQVSTNANYTFNVTSNHNLVAVFQIQTHTINVSASPSNGGSVSGGGTYNHGQSCTVHAVANSGYTFVRWTENGNQVSTNANYTFNVTSNHNLVAVFQAQTYTISVSANPSNGGTVSGGGTYQQGQSCTVHAVANSGYTFTNWTENGNVVSTNANYTFTVTGNRSLVANFTAQPQSYTISVSANPSNGGTVSGGGTYQQGQSCTVHAVANSGYTFTNWTENGNVVSTNANYTFTVTGNRSLVAVFQAQTYTYTIFVSANPSNGGTVTGGGTYNQGQSCTVHAVANSGYTFVRWTENGNQVSTNANYTFTVTGNRTLVAVFQVQTYNITTAVSPLGSGYVTGGGTYEYGQTCTLVATPNSGYIFDHWSRNGQTIDGGATISFQVTQTANYVAYFTAVPQAPTGAINGVFTINSSNAKVWFSQGNLQYIGSSQTWEFADHQWTTLGNNGQGSTSQNVNRDLFGWGTSGYNHGATCYQPWSTSTNDNDYWAYGSGSYNLYDQTGQADWGYHAISNGGNTTNTWRTLTSEEWQYIFTQRTTSSGKRFAKAQVNNVSGVILLPDNWSESYYSLVSCNSTGVNYTTNVISSSDWNTLEQHGAVFLPAGGYREGTTVNLTANGEPICYYWSATRSTNATASCVYITRNSITYNQPYHRYWGQCVRLVRPAN